MVFYNLNTIKIKKDLKHVLHVSLKPKLHLGSIDVCIYSDIKGKDLIRHGDKNFI